MNCSHFGKCGSCSSYKLSYKDALNAKQEMVFELLKPYYGKSLEVFDSPKSAHRARAEFKIWHKSDRCYYAMGNYEKNGVELLNECPKVINTISSIQYKLLDFINSKSILKEKLFSIEFLASKSGGLLVTLIYHKKLDEAWQIEAKELEKQFKVHIIGRARKQKIVLSQEFIKESLKISGESFSYNYYEGGFTEPNP